MKRNLFLSLIFGVTATAYAETTWVDTAKSLAGSATAWDQDEAVHTSASHKPKDEGIEIPWIGTHTTGNWKIETPEGHVGSFIIVLDESLLSGSSEELEAPAEGIIQAHNIGCYKGMENKGMESAPASALTVSGTQTTTKTENCLFIGGVGYVGGEKDTATNDFLDKQTPQEGFVNVLGGATLTVGTKTPALLGAQLNVGQGKDGVGHLLVDGASHVSSEGEMTVASGAGSHGDVLVDNGSDITVQAAEHIKNGGSNLHLGVGAGSEANITLDNRSTMSVLKGLNPDHKYAQSFIGQDGTGTLTAKGGSTLLLDGTTVLGYNNGSEGTLNVQGSSLAVAETLELGGLAGSEGTLNVEADSTVVVTNTAYVGLSGKGTLVNDGTVIGKTHVNGTGELHGSGTFGTTTVTGGGKVFVGDDAPVTQTYTGNLTLAESSTSFSVTDLTLPSEEAQSEWISASHSLIKMKEGTKFAITKDAKFLIDFSGSELPSEAPIVDLGDFSILLVEGGVGSDVAKLCGTLLNNSVFTFHLTDSAADAWTANIKGAHYLVANNNLYLVANSIPEPATATLSLLALAGLCARRRRK